MKKTFLLAILIFLTSCSSDSSKIQDSSNTDDSSEINDTAYTETEEIGNDSFDEENNLEIQDVTTDKGYEIDNDTEISDDDIFSCSDLIETPSGITAAGRTFLHSDRS